MTQAVQEILSRFDQLPDAEKREAASAIFQRVRTLDVDALSDEDFVLSAEALFLELDRRESSDGRA